MKVDNIKMIEYRALLSEIRADASSKRKREESVDGHSVPSDAESGSDSATKMKNKVTITSSSTRILLTLIRSRPTNRSENSVDSANTEAMAKK